jgi:hypothetical protein
MYSDLFSGVQ